MLIVVRLGCVYRYLNSILISLKNNKIESVVLKKTCGSNRDNVNFSSVEEIRIRIIMNKNFRPLESSFGGRFDLPGSGPVDLLICLCLDSKLCFYGCVTVLSTSIAEQYMVFFWLRLIDHI